jgi:hypothetical protein
VNKFVEAFHGSRCPDGFKYNSGTNTQWLSVPELRQLIRKHVDSSFVVEESIPTESKKRLAIIRKSPPVADRELLVREDSVEVISSGQP